LKVTKTEERNVIMKLTGTGTTNWFKPLSAASLLLAAKLAALAQPFAVGYQGRLFDGSTPANGNYDFTFTFYQSPTGGTPLFGPVTNLDVAVSNGLFTTYISLIGINTNIFGSGINAANFLEIAARTNNPSLAFLTLTPRERLVNTPYAISAESLSGTMPTTQLSGMIGNSQLANSSITVYAGTGLTGGGTVALGGSTTLNNAGVTSLAGGGGVTVSAAGGAVTLGSTATSANIPNTIVSRDSSGNFSAGSITLAGPLYLPDTGIVSNLVYSGSTPVLYADDNANSFFGPGAGNPNSPGALNTAVGNGALTTPLSSALGYTSENTAVGWTALYQDWAGNYNTAVGAAAMFANVGGDDNTAVGVNALANSQHGDYNTAVGVGALGAGVGEAGNTGVGAAALEQSTGSRNIGLGYNAGMNLTTGDDNIEIGNTGTSSDNSFIRIGTEGTHGPTYIAGIYGKTVSGSSVTVNSSGQLGVAPSSQRFKQQIQTMGSASDVLYALKPVNFRYKPEIDPEGTPQFGLVAEEVQKVAPELVAHDVDGKPFTVRYEAVNAMLLNEFLKQHQKVEEQSGQLQELKQENKTLAKQLSELQALVKSIAEKQ
jgi:hypothetical protein